MAIREYLAENESKVILLSATPYNKTFLDLSSQLRLFLSEENDLGISPENYINSIGGKVQFTARHQTPLRSIAAFEKSDFVDDWRELMRLFLVRRTRSFIKKHYAQKDPENNRLYLTFPDGGRSYFPDRIPKKVEYPFDPDDHDDQYASLYDARIVGIINSLNLPRYGLGNYLAEDSDMSPTSQEQIIRSNLSRAGKRLMGFCRTNLFKRLESSGHAFLLSLTRHLLRNYIYVYAIENRLPLPIGTQELNLLDEFMDDQDPDFIKDDIRVIPNEEIYYNQAEKVYDFCRSSANNRFQWIRSKLFTGGLKEDLKNDIKLLFKILDISGNWEPKQDRKINALQKLCVENHPKEKLLIFTQFSDTAHYLYDELIKRGIKNTACVTGGVDNPSSFAWRFSPKSNEKTDRISKEQEIRVLITTDVLSEGQNLQDGHIIVNYDLPWASIRLVQRAGRVDRIGQRAEQILCYCFLPEDGIEQIIRLRGRLKERISENAEVVGSDETFFDGDPINIHDLYNEEVILDDDEDEDVDLASYAFQIWKDAIDNDASLKKTIPELPNVIYATRDRENISTDEGVVVYTRTSGGNDILAWLNKAGEIITQSQFTILKAVRCRPDTLPAEKIENHHELVQTGVEHINDVESRIGGQLGKKSGARYRVYMRLDRYVKEFEDTLFVSEPLKRAIDDIYRFSLKEFSKETLNRQLKAGITDSDLVSLVVSLREEDKLSVSGDDETVDKAPQIICSMGLT